jgi:hypothetical protein
LLDKIGFQQELSQNIKESIQQNDITNIDIYELNIRAPKYMNQIWADLKEK